MRALSFVSRRKRRLFYGICAAVLVLLGSAILFYFLERGSNSEIDGIHSGFLWVTLTLLEQASPWDITTGGGMVLRYTVLIAGVSLVAMGTGAVALKLMEAVSNRERGRGRAKVDKHIVICGWSNKGIEILRELHAEEVADKRPVVILAPLESCPTTDPLVDFVSGNPNNAEDLLRAGINRATTAIILADRSNPACMSDDVDAKTLLATLAVESINPNCYTCVEVIKSANRQHFERTKADELIVSAELTGALLASSAVTHGLSRVVSDLVTHPQGTEFYASTAPVQMVGKLFGTAMVELKEQHDCIPIALKRSGGDYLINPSSNERVQEGDKFLLIASGEVNLESPRTRRGLRVQESFNVRLGRKPSSRTDVLSA